MLDKLHVQARLNNLQNEIIPQSVEASVIHRDKVNLVAWIYNDGKLRTENEMRVKENNIRDELVAYGYANDTGYLTKSANARLQELINLK